jgi:hypothetical protein
MTTNVTRGADVRTRAKLLEEGWHPCSVVGCDALWRRGGRAGEEPLCPAHYHRERRGSPLADVPGRPALCVVLTYRAPPQLADVVRLEQLALRRARRPSSVSDALTSLLERLQSLTTRSTEGRPR